jgi:hypothetical protein
MKIILLKSLLIRYLRNILEYYTIRKREKSHDLHTYVLYIFLCQDIIVQLSRQKI